MSRWIVLLVALAGCAAGERRFPVREPMWRDTDLDAMSVPCRPDPKKPGHRICRPETYTSSWAWDGADNMLFRPLARLFAVDPGGEAVNVNSVDEVPDSSWFVNRIGRRAMTPAEVLDGSCDGDRIGDDQPDGSIVVDQGKDNGANPGFRIKLPDGRKYMLKAETNPLSEKATAATSIAARLYHAAGWYAPCDSVVYLRPEALRLTPGLTITNNQNVTRPFDRAALDKILAHTAWRDGRARFAASRWLPGRTIGPFTYEGTAADEPGDVIPHQDRRDLRGARLMAAWMNHWDSREQNSMRVWLSEDPSDPDASPGRVLHYYMDMGDSFGSDWTIDEFNRRFGHTYLMDFGSMMEDLFTFGLVSRPWHRAERSAEGDIFGYFSARDFDPEGWVGEYPNPTFQRMTEHDGAWAARIIARFSDELIEAAVRAGDFSKPRHAAYLAAQLRARRDIILRRYFAKLSPIADLAVTGGKLCGVDLARRARIFPADLFRYDAGGLPVAAGADGAVCVTLPRASGYLIVTLHNGQARGALEAHILEGRLVGVERSDS